ncbi:hypothetical protein Focb16_v003136 [Fusarium oxysporum f. sp. cubense]|uniref:Uncharacterized protein n=1 Tax=Fusarium oxysporum f. sp. cubense TaxID=61366 RepID=A0A559L6H6_FUSOC|nr:hypothetical protein Focb16_v003136 [Fusarium oxysporum f. sp. cubense]
MWLTDGTVDLFGAETALIQIEPDKARRWHFLRTPGRVVSLEDIKSAVSSLGPDIERDIREGEARKFTYEPGMAYIGWCDSPKIQIGTRRPPSSLLEAVVRPSAIPIPSNNILELAEESKSRSVNLNFQVGFSGIATAEVGGERGRERTYTVPNLNRFISPEQFPTFEETLAEAKSTPCILWDNWAKRAWLLPGITALLFTSLCRIEKLGWAVHDMTYAEPSDDPRGSAQGCLLDNQAKKIMTKTSGLLKERFSVFVQRVWSGMIDAEKVRRSRGGEGTKHRVNGVVFGYDLADLLSSRSVKLRYLDSGLAGRNLESWVRLAQEDDVMVIFCGRIGPVIDCKWVEHVEADGNDEQAVPYSCSCSDSCRDWPSTNGVLSTFLQDLSSFSSKDWKSEASNSLPIRQGITWTPTGLDLFEHGRNRRSGGTACTCCQMMERLQSFKRTDRPDRRPNKIIRFALWISRQPEEGAASFRFLEWFDKHWAVRFGLKQDEPPN